MQKNIKSQRALYSLERLVSTELQDGVRETYVNHYLDELNSAVSEAELLLSDAKNILKNQRLVTPIL